MKHFLNFTTKCYVILLNFFQVTPKMSCLVHKWILVGKTQNLLKFRQIMGYTTSTVPWLSAAKTAGSGKDEEMFHKKLERYSIYHPTPISLHHFIGFAKNSTPQTSFMFLKHELPVRLANIMKELQLLPYDLHQTQAGRVS